MYFSFSVIFSFLAIIQVLQCAFLIFHVFQGIEQGGDVVSYDEAIVKHRLALANTVVKRAKSSEKAYTCLKTAWLLRGKAEHLPEDTADYNKVRAELAAEEREFLENAYNGFLEAFPKEMFPMCGMDENTVSYLVADLARRIGKYEDASRWVARVLASRNANDRIKEKSRELKDLITEEMKAEV